MIESPPQKEGGPLKTTSQHILVEYMECNRDTLNRVDAIERLLVAAAEAAKAHIVDRVFHQYAPQGVSGVVVVEESHLSVHTWPEAGYAAVDFFTCGECTPERAIEVIRAGLEARHHEVLFLMRGMCPEEPSIQNRSHYHESAKEGLLRSYHEVSGRKALSTATSAEECPVSFVGQK